MALTIKKSAKESTVSVADLLKALQKDHGEEIGSFGGKLVNSERIPTGLFPIDLALGGGFPRGRCSIVYGPESSLKTNLVLKAIAMHQMIWPELTNVFVDVEHSFDPAWAQQLGVDTSKLVVIKPSFAEQAVDMVESFMHADNCGIVAVDSLAALVTSSELEASAERANVGGAAVVIGKLTRKTTHAMSEAEKRGRYPTIIYINQTTYEIGKMFGNPEKMPGGKKPYFQGSLILRLYGKDVMDHKFSTAIPVRKNVTYQIIKKKCPVYNMGGQFEMALVDHGNLKVGQCADFNELAQYLKSFGLFEKAQKKGWTIMGEHYDVIDTFKDKVYGDAKFGAAVRQEVIGRLASANGMIMPDEAEPEEAASE